MITRVRIEAVGKTEDQVRDELLDAAKVVRDYDRANWEEEEPIKVLDAKEGFWGRFTIRRIK